MSKILNSRDLNKRLSELTDLQDTLKAAREVHKQAIAALEAFKAEHVNDVDLSGEDEHKLENELAELKTAVDEAESDIASAESEFGEDEKEELAELENMESEITEWRYGATLVPESEWVDYVREMLADTGDLPRDLPSYIAIDWEETADNIRADYSEVEYQGETYLYRC